MCELFGFSSNKISKPDDRMNSMLREFFSHGSENPHGWGMAVFSGGRPDIIREAGSSADSVLLGKVLGQGISSDLVIAHIRLATKGAVSMENTHPFSLKDKRGNDWVLAHNGTVFESDALSGYRYGQKGETDSERILMYLTDRVSDGFDREAADTGNMRSHRSLRYSRIQAVEEGIREITPGNKVNLLISDGSLLYAHMNYRGSMHMLRTEGTVFISSKPLIGSWEELPLNTLVVFESGSLIYRGIPHRNEYIEDEEKTRMLFLDYANI